MVSLCARQRAKYLLAGSINKLDTTNNYKNASQEHQSPKGNKSGGDSCIRLRAFIVGLLLIPLDTYWVISMEKVHYGPYPTVISIFINTIFALFVLAGINSLVKRLRPQWAFSMAEMLVVYAMITIATALAGHDMAPTIVATMSYPTQAAPNYPTWAETWLSYLPQWLSVTDMTYIKPLYQGGSSLYVDGNWKPWIAPSLWWISFFVALIFVMMCINTLVRKQWMESERLTFPIVQLPLAMTEPKGEIWRSKLFWIAFAIAGGLELINGLAFYFPQIPSINLTEREHDLGLGITNLPWSAIGWMPWSLYPFVIGLGYLLPVDLSFSMWFFYLFWKLEKIVWAMMGMESGFDAPYIRQQGFGGAMGLVLVLVWNSRGYLKQVWHRIIGANSDLDDSTEPMSYRAAAIGAIIGFIYVVLFFMRMGMTPLIAVIGFVIYFALAIAVARIRAELGPPVHDMPFTPDYIMTTTAGVGYLSKGDIIGLGHFQAFHGAYRSHPMPIGMEGMKMAQTTGSSQRKFMWAIMIAAVVGAVATFWAYLHLAYKFGLDTKWNYNAAWAWGVTSRISRWWDPAPAAARPDWAATTAVGAGFGFCLLMGYARLRILNWPFHPIGFIISGTYQANLVWVPILVAWAAKVIILRYGGLKLYRTALPFFLGLILGEMVMGCLWGIIGITFNIPYYNFFGA